MASKGFKSASVSPGGDGRLSTGSPAVDRPRRDPETILAAAAAVAPTLPPTRVEAPPQPADPVAQLNLKVRASLIDQLAEAARQEGTTQKVVVCRALAAAGYAVHPDDLDDRSNHRRRRL